MISRVYRSMLFFQFVDNCNFIAIAVRLCMHTFIPTFFVWRFHTPCLSTDERFSLFPAILVTQVLAGAMSNTPPIGVLLFSPKLMDFQRYICVWDPDRDFAPLLKDYTPSSLRLCFPTSIFNFILRDTPFYFWSLCDEFILSHVGAEGEWFGLRS